MKRTFGGRVATMLCLLGFPGAIHGLRSSLLFHRNSKPHFSSMTIPHSLQFPIQWRNQISLESTTETATDETDGYHHHRHPMMDPLLTRVLLRRDDDEDDESLQNLGSLSTASTGLAVWRSALLKGRLAIPVDFPFDQEWPPTPLFQPLTEALVQLQLPRFVLRHPDTLSAVLLSMLRLLMEFQARSSYREPVEEEEEEEPVEWFGKDDGLAEYENGPEEYETQVLPLSEEELELLAQEIAAAMVDEWGGVIGGVHSLDQLFGANHGLLNAGLSDTTDGGFGVQDTAWEHSGWQMMPDLQKQVASMVELRELVKSLGRRPTAEGSDAVHKFAPRRLHPDGALGAHVNPLTQSSVKGLTLSSSLSEMLPSEAILLKGKSPALRRLFWAKKMEAKLLSYDLAGWVDAPSIPRPRPRYLPRMPSAPGGPIVVCLDTSWSMSGMREQLSKAVVLACVSAAHKQHRECKVVAFSTERGVMEAGEISADIPGVQRLLEFLSHSFGGGTDVTGALKHAMATLDTDSMSAADLLLVTDGEIPDPPVSEDVMEQLNHLKQRTGLQVHGLLVGKSESKPLTKLCSYTHDFLIKYDTLAAAASSISNGGLATQPPKPSSWDALLARNRQNTPNGSRTSSALSAHKTSAVPRPSFQTYGWWSDLGAPMGRRVGATSSLYARRNKGGRKSRWDDEDDEFYEESWGRREEIEDEEDESEARATPVAGSFHALAKEATDQLRASINLSLQEQLWSPAELDDEKNGEGSCWRYRSELKAAVDRIGEGLVEREEESRLLVLGMAAQEHILFLGPPGTGKSVLGQRLSKLCGGYFFQRLMTRFTTPEEIFGPLSLRALENDEYRRCTTGFMPTASVAFLDEIFKANSAILNTILTILNERQFDNGAGVREECPIRCVVGASNELPESDELDALYDRFLLRKEVRPVSDEGIVKLLGMSAPGVSVCDNVDDPGTKAECEVVFTDGLDNVIKELSKAADTVHFGDDPSTLMRDLRTFMREELDVDVSDRRLVKAARLLKVSAASHGRTRVDALDCLLLQHIVWQLPEHRSAVREWLWDNVTPGGTLTSESPSSAAAQFRLLLDNIRREALLLIRKTAGDVSGNSGAREAEISAIEALQSEASRIASLLQQRSTALARHMELLRRSMDHLWLDPDEARAAQQILLPKAKAFSLEIDRALADGRALELALSEDSASPRNDLRLSVIEMLWDEESPEATFSSEELSIGMKEAKAKYDGDTFRAWKRARKKATK